MQASILLFDGRTLDAVKRIQSSAQGFTCLAFSPDCAHVVATTAERSLLVYSIASGGEPPEVLEEKQSRCLQAIIGAASSREAAQGCCPIYASLGQQPMPHNCLSITCPVCIPQDFSNHCQTYSRLCAGHASMYATRVQPSMSSLQHAMC